MNSDCVYRIGRSHAVCQDYAVARGGAQPFVILADGCSSSPDTDIGARLLVKAAERCIDHFAPPEDVRRPVPPGWECDTYHCEAIRAARRHAARLGISGRALDATLLTLAVRGDRWIAAVCGDGVVAMKDREGRLHVRSIAFAEGMPRYLSYAVDAARGAAFLAHRENRCEVERFVLEPDAPPAPQCWGESAPTSQGAVSAPFDKLHTPPSIGGPGGPSPVSFWETGEVAAYEWVAVMSDGVHSFTEARVTETVRTSAPVPLAAVLRELLAFKSTNGVFVQRRVQRLLRAGGGDEGCPYSHHDDLAVGVIALGE